MIALLRWTFTPDRLHYWRSPDRWKSMWERDGRMWTEKSALGEPFYGWPYASYPFDMNGDN